MSLKNEILKAVDEVVRSEKTGEQDKSAIKRITLHVMPVDANILWIYTGCISVTRHTGDTDWFSLDHMPKLVRDLAVRAKELSCRAKWTIYDTDKQIDYTPHLTDFDDTCLDALCF